MGGECHDCMFAPRGCSNCEDNPLRERKDRLHPELRKISFSCFNKCGTEIEVSQEDGTVKDNSCPECEATYRIRTFKTKDNVRIRIRRTDL